MKHPKLPPLYKFLSRRGAELTLLNARFKHSKPSDFNDTKDLTLDSIFPGSTVDSLKILKNGLSRILLSNPKRYIPNKGPLSEKLKILQNSYNINQILANIVESEMTKMDVSEIYNLDSMKVINQSYVEYFNKFLQDYRVFCVTTDALSDRMWKEYAEEYSGIAIRIDPCREKDSKFQLFRPVAYKVQRPPLYISMDEFLEAAIFERAEETIVRAIDRIIYTKTREWEYEKEYRLVIPKMNHEAEWNTMPFHSQEIGEIIVGQNAKISELNCYIKLTKKINPRVSLSIAYQGENEVAVTERIF